jgi:hypothetical protein
VRRGIVAKSEATRSASYEVSGRLTPSEHTSRRASRTHGRPVLDSYPVKSAVDARGLEVVGGLNLGAPHANLRRPSPATPIVYGASAGSVEFA